MAMIVLKVSSMNNPSSILRVYIALNLRSVVLHLHMTATAMHVDPCISRMSSHLIVRTSAGVHLGGGKLAFEEYQSLA